MKAKDLNKRLRELRQINAIGGLPLNQEYTFQTCTHLPPKSKRKYGRLFSFRGFKA